MKKIKLNLEALEFDNSIEILDAPDLLTFFKGGTGSVSTDCVFNCFNYLDGSSYGYANYYYNTFYQLGYTPTSNGGGVSTSDISRIGQFGHMQVTELSGGAGATINSSNGTVSGGAYSGSRIMMTYAGVGGADHAVVVTGVTTVNGVQRVNYYDPTTNSYSYRNSGDYSALYAVGGVGSASYTGPNWGGS